MSTDTDWARLARAAGRCLAIADDLDLDARVMAGLPGGIGQARYIRSDAAHYRKLAGECDTKARALHEEAAHGG